MATPDPEVLARLSKPGRVKNINPGLPKRGKIKIGGRGPARKNAQGKTWYPPVKYNHFEIRLLERGTEAQNGTNYLRDEAVHSLPNVGDDCTRLPVLLLYNNPDLNFSSKLGFYRVIKMKNSKGETIDSRQPWCQGDGEVAIRYVTDDKGFWGGELDQRKCPCELYDQGKCKPNGVLNVLIEGAPLGGTYEFRTTGKKTTAALEGSMDFIRDVTGGQIAGIPLDLVLRFMPARTRDGVETTIPVVVLEWTRSVKALQEEGRKLLENKSYQEHMRETEAMARELKTANVFGDTEEEREEIAGEFFPDGDDDGGQGGAPAKPATDTKPAAEPKSANDKGSPDGSLTDAEREAIRKHTDTPAIDELL